MLDVPPPWTKGFPLRENCNPADRYEAFVWMWAAPPGQNGGPLVRAVSYLQAISARLWDLGCRPAQEPTLTYHLPRIVDPNWATSAGIWRTSDGAPARIAVPEVQWDKGFPIRENCDPDDPFEVFVWMLVALPDLDGGPLVYPTPYLQLISKRLWDLGVRATQEPVLQHRPSSWSDPNIYTAPGDWVPVQKAVAP